MRLRARLALSARDPKLAHSLADEADCPVQGRDVKLHAAVALVLHGPQAVLGTLRTFQGNAEEAAQARAVFLLLDRTGDALACVAAVTPEGTREAETSRLMAMAAAATGDLERA